MQLKLTGKDILLAEEAIDFRKSIDGLCGLVTDLSTEKIYVFYNKARNKLKILGWHGNGFILLYKRLEKRKFIISGKNKSLDLQQLSWLLAGLDWEEMSNFGELEYKDFY